MNPTIPASGYTPQGSAVQSLQQALSQISGMAQGASQDPSTAVSNAVTSASNAQLPTNVQNVTNQLTQQSGIPALQGQQENLGQIFQMYLADQNIAQKYANPTLQSGNSPLYGNQNLNTQGSAMANLGTPNTFNDPYLSSPQALVSAITGNKGSGLAFNGFSTPSQNTQEMGVVPNSAQSIIKTLQSGIDSQQGLVNTSVGNYQTQYGNVMSTLNNLLTNQAATSFSQAQPGSAQSVQKSLSSLKADVLKKMTLKQIMAKYSTDPNLDANKILQIYNENSPWGQAKEDPQTLANMYGVSGGLGKTPASSSQTKYQLKTIGTTQYNYDPKTGKLFDMNGKQLNANAFSTQNELQDVFGKLQQAWQAAKSAPTPANRQKYMTEKQLMADKLYYALTKSRAYQGAQQLVTKLPDPWNPIDTLGGQGDAAFSGFEEQLNLGGNQAVGGSSSSSSGGADRQSIVTKLKAGGYSDNDIHAYLKQKGIDN